MGCEVTILSILILLAGIFMVFYVGNLWGIVLLVLAILLIVNQLLPPPRMKL